MYKHRKRLQDAYGCDEYGMLQVPTKVSGRSISRSLFTRITGGCSWCFPHGSESTTPKAEKQQRNWKSYRRTQWKETQRVDADHNIDAENHNDNQPQAPHHGTTID